MSQFIESHTMACHRSRSSSFSHSTACRQRLAEPPAHCLAANHRVRTGTALARSQFTQEPCNAPAASPYPSTGGQRLAELPAAIRRVSLSSDARCLEPLLTASVAVVSKPPVCENRDLLNRLNTGACLTANRRESALATPLARSKFIEKCTIA